MDMSSTTDKHHLRRRLCWDTVSQLEPPSLNHRQDLNRSRSQPQDRRGCSGGMLREEMTQEIPVPNLAPNDHDNPQYPT